jgi:hypothetical protein
MIGVGRKDSSRECPGRFPHTPPRFVPSGCSARGVKWTGGLRLPLKKSGILRQFKTVGSFPQDKFFIKYLPNPYIALRGESKY